MIGGWFVDFLGETSPTWALLLGALPGITYAATRGYARGIANQDTSLASRFAQGLMAAVVFDLVYVAVFGSWLTETMSTDVLRSRPRAAALAVLTLGVLVPALVAWTLHRGHQWTHPSDGPISKLLESAPRESIGKLCTKYVGRFTRRFSSVPRAWDFALPDRGCHFVRIETAGGKFLGGWFAKASFFSTYPEPHDIFVEVQYRMTSTGEFKEPVTDSMGFWYAIQPGDSIEWIKEPAASPITGGSP